jgi:hypothetical protein
MFKHHVYTRSQKENTHKALWSINMENEAYIIKYIKQLVHEKLALVTGVDRLL